MTAYVPSAQNATTDQIVRSLKEQASGRSNATNIVTLRSGQTTTVVNDDNFVAGSSVMFMPMTQNAAYALNGWSSASINPLYVDNSTQGAFTIHHTSIVASDMTLVYAIIG